MISRFQISIKKFFTRFHVWTQPFQKGGTPCNSLWSRKACISFWVSDAYSWMVKLKYIYDGKQCSSFHRKHAKPYQRSYKELLVTDAESFLWKKVLKECNSLSYDAMTAHTAVVFTGYMMLSLESWESNDNRSLCELFLYFSDEMSDITWIQAFQMLLQMFRTMLSDNTELSDEKINELASAFMNTLPAMLKIRLHAI